MQGGLLLVIFAHNSQPRGGGSWPIFCSMPQDEYSLMNDNCNSCNNSFWWAWIEHDSLRMNIDFCAVCWYYYQIASYNIINFFRSSFNKFIRSLFHALMIACICLNLNICFNCLHLLSNCLQQFEFVHLNSYLIISKNHHAIYIIRWFWFEHILFIYSYTVY